MTIASLGLSTKTAEIIRLTTAGCRSNWTGFDLDTRPRALQSFQDHRLPLFQAAGDDRQGGGRLAQLDGPAVDFVVRTDDKDKIAAQIRHHRGARDAERGHRLNALDQHGDESAIDQRPLDTPSRLGRAPNGI